jgi:hypothetical protein
MQYRAYGEAASGGSRWTIRTGLSSDADAETGTGGAIVVQMRQPLFVMVNNMASYSYDGVAWQVADVPVVGNWYGLTYADGKYVAVGADYNGTDPNAPRLAISEDGINWTQGTLGPHSWCSVGYGDKVLIAVSADGYIARTAENSTAFGTPVQIPGISEYRGVAFGKNNFVIVSREGPLYSTDKGAAWTKSTVHNPNPAAPATDPYWHGLGYGNGIFVAATYNSGEIFCSVDDGMTWNKITTISGAKWAKVGYGNGMFIISADSGTPELVYSTDPVTPASWKSDINIVGTRWYGIAYGNGKYVAVSRDNQAAYSTDGKNWDLGTGSAGVIGGREVVYGSAGVSSIEEVVVATGN